MNRIDRIGNLLVRAELRDQIKDLLFHVELRPVYTDTHDGQKMISQSQAVVNAETDQILGVVGAQYKLLTNEKAVELGNKCFSKLFESELIRDIEIFGVDAPSTASFCRIDLVHPDYVMNLWDNDKISETYIPYVRITNSYNASRALRFDVGFCRKICNNGMIFETETIAFKYNHTKSELLENIEFHIEPGKMDKLFESFSSHVEKLRKYKIGEERSLEIARALFGIKDKSAINFDDERESRTDYETLADQFKTKLNSYVGEMGSNGYALFNLITEIASYKSPNHYLRREKNTMQRMAGTWINSFQIEISKKDFSLNDYIKSLKPSPIAATG